MVQPLVLTLLNFLTLLTYGFLDFMMVQNHTYSIEIIFQILNFDFLLGVGTLQEQPATVSTRLCDQEGIQLILYCVL